MAEHSQSSRLPMKPRLFFDALIPTVTASEGSQAKPFALASGRQVPKGNGFKGLWLGPSGEVPDRNSVVWGTRVQGRVDLGGLGLVQKRTKNRNISILI